MKKKPAKQKPTARKEKDSFAQALEAVMEGAADSLVELAGLGHQEVLAALDKLKEEGPQVTRLALLGVAWKKQDVGLPFLAAALRHQDATLGQEAAAALALVKSRSAADLLAEAVADPALVHLHKQARKSLYLLKTGGITPVLEPDMGEAVAKQLSKSAPEVVYKAFMSYVDGVGSRSIICAVPGGPRGLDTTFLLLNDQVGIKDCWTVQFSKKRFSQVEKFWTRKEKGDSDYSTYAEVDPDYIKFLLGKYYRLNIKSGFTPPTHLHTFRRMLGEPMKDYSKHPVYQVLDEAQIRANLRKMVEDSSLLLDEQEMEGWFFGLDEVEGEARALLALLPERSTHEPAGWEALWEKCRRKAAARLLAGIHLERWATRLEDLAYYFASRKSADTAAWCLAIVMALREGENPLEIPFFYEMVDNSLWIAVNALKDGVRPEAVAYDPYKPV
ncbi:hypothetical protein SY88_13805 [Clostridiales bacterium PH28_bin88]|nr:hypothetical protein SY88_13805 [Clostridiales bacterium PH28_bin88]